MKHLHPGVRWLWRVGFIITILFLSGFISAWLRGMRVFASFLPSFLIILILLAVVAEIYVRLAYDRWKYELGHTELKIEKGIIWKTYKSIPFTRVQNVDIRRGVIARILGFSTLDVQTAGYSGYQARGRRVAEGHIPAVSVEEAEHMREFVMKRIGKAGM